MKGSTLFFGKVIYFLRANRTGIFILSVLKNISDLKMKLLILILNTSPRNENTSNRNLDFKTHYNQPDNLFFLVQCPIGQYDLQYQFLKIR